MRRCAASIPHRHDFPTLVLARRLRHSPGQVFTSWSPGGGTIPSVMLRSSSPSGFSWTSRAQETLAIEKIRQCSLFRRESRLNPLPASLARERTTLKNPSGEFLRAATRLDMARCRTGHRTAAFPVGLTLHVVGRQRETTPLTVLRRMAVGQAPAEAGVDKQKNVGGSY
ncbi:hypothetical protein VTN49DRAFT_5085 [Thermomyces lanuginosus]|uniref:uncharacterized protein n=1 Tax=Thermomyces lanuginosus TaxID=5541 RepID=UPI0037437C54